MARLSRLALGGQVHLLELPALVGARLVQDDDDRRALLAALQAAAQQHRIAVHAYCLLDDVLLLLATPSDAEGLSRLVQGLGRRYVPRLHRRHGTSGRLWGGRFRATIVQPGRRVLDAMVFIELAGMRLDGAARAAEHTWASTRHHLGAARDALLANRAEYWHLGNTPFDRERAWRDRLDEGLGAARAAELAAAMHKGWVDGDAAFITTLADLTDRPLQPRRRGRPPRATQPTPRQ